MPKPLKPAPHPWRKEDHQGKGFKIVAADGSTVAMVHYPKTPPEATNLDLILRAPILLERLKSLVIFWKAFPQFTEEQRHGNPTVVSAEALIKEIETIEPPEKPKGPEVL
jgi:hypothetical protein